MRVLDATTQKVLAELNQCVHASAEFAKAGEFPTDAPLALATVDAAACPEDLGVTDAEFNTLFQGKVALWLSDTPSDVACEKDFYAPQAWYKRLVEAGALGVVTLVPYVGRQAGIYYDSFDRKAIWDGSVLQDLPQAQYIPFLFCSNDLATDLGEPGSQASITAFVNSWYEKPESRVAPFNAPLVVDSLVTSENPWPVMFETTLYVVVMRVVVPLMFWSVFVGAVAFSYERFKKALEMRRTLWSAMTPPLVAMLVEAATVFLLGVFYAVDGQWSNTESTLKGFRLLFFGELLLLSLSSSVLVGLTFGDFRRTSKRLQHLAANSFVQRHRGALLAASAGLMALEVLSGVLRRIQFVYQALNAVSILVGALIAAWFFYEAKMFTGILKTLATSNNAPASTGSNEMLRGMVRHIQNWSYAASFTIAVSLIAALIATFHPYTLWRTVGWAAFWLCFHSLRAFLALCKVQLCRLPRNQRDLAGEAGLTTQDNGGMTAAKTSTFMVGSPSYAMMPNDELPSISI
jgi:hypothetical protein